ncbi:molybdopterin-dependent oxidoreductase [Loktanella sp. Alg231-35]|uniref:molybdopterin-dependent oxidoreductase n=1 Tax=Loktanella sp. Alg231-35 TaxID=1922220 RepID=UPI000D54E73B|nr:molybdopterin-dependent oxidoreductase [Loktanella sp. Alg231-35]
MYETMTISVIVNGTAYTCEVAPHVTLLDFLRDTLDLKGAKECCAVGECGACTLKVAGETVNSCLFLAVEADGCEIETIEGVAQGDTLSPVQDAFLTCGAVQCGFCIPGMVMSAEDLMAQNGAPSETEVREALSGNLCRCGGYNRMFDAVNVASGHAEEVKMQTGHADTGATVGTNAVRAGGVNRVTGHQAFVADLEIDGMVHLKLVTLNAARAEIISIDIAAACAVPGVLDVITAADLPDPMPRFGPVFKDRPIMADGETQYHGEPVAVVAAEDKDIAAYAASLVKVDYETLPAVTDFAAALAPDAPLVQPNAEARSNILKARDYGWGDVDSVNAALVVDNRYSFPMVTHFAIEPHGFIVSAKPDGMTIWSPVQHPYLLQKIMAELFDHPLSAVRVLAADPGGGFGGKQNPKFEPLVAYASLRLGRPCRLILTLEETFQAVRRAAADVHIRTGFAQDGEILFQDIKSDYLIGAYVDIAERVMTKGNYLGCGPYRVKNARVHARAVLSHTTPSTAFRGFGTPQINWAVESQIDAGARALGLDGLNIRLRNLAGRGDEVVKGDFPADGDWPASVKMAAEMVGWTDPLPEGRGRGIAVGVKSGATTGLSNSTVRLLADGSVIVYAGTSDMGQGARTIFAQLAADAFGAPLDRVSVVMGDTSVVPFDLQTSASRSTVFMGTALTRACEDIQRQVLELACETSGLSEADIAVGNGTIQIAGEFHSIFDFVQQSLGKWNGELVGTGRMRKPTDPEHALGGTPAFFEFNCTAFEVEVDEATGEILIHKHVTVGDVGKALNPLQVEMQDEGAAIMGLGHSVMEQIIMDDEGRIKNLGAIDYRIVTTKDMPLSMKTGMVENQDGPGPYGSKGVSEGAILCTAPALAAAVAQATGAVVHDLPLSPERLWAALQSK